MVERYVYHNGLNWVNENDPKAVRTNMAPPLPTQRMVDEFGFPMATTSVSKAIQLEDLELIRQFLRNLKDQTLSRGVFKVLEDLLERLK